MSHEKYLPLIDTLNDCAIECNHCMISCLNEKDVTMMAACIKLDLDCAEICRLVASFASRGSVHAQHMMKECAEICNACAAECERFSHMDHCKKCAEACRKCAEECSMTIDNIVDL